MNGRWAECPGLSSSSWHGWGAGSVWFVLLAVAFSSGARRALQRSVRGQKLQWATPATTSKDLPYRKADTPHHTHTHTYSHTMHTQLSLVNTYIYSWEAQNGVQKATGKREKLSFDLKKKTKKNVCTIAVKEKRRFGVMCFVITSFSFHYTAACSNMWIQDTEWKLNVGKKNVGETLKLTQTVTFFCIFLFTFASLVLSNIISVCR